MRAKILSISDAQKLKIEGRDPKYKDADISCVKAIAQAAVNVELFTIPLYMTSMYSIVGTHQILGSNAFYEGRWWPGLGPSRQPDTGNKKAFNLIFSVFIEEMLHLQLAGNMNTAIGNVPTFTSPFLMDQTGYGWVCYGTPGNPSYTIPHILDLNDTTTYEGVQVQLATMNEEQIKLFLAIEETIEDGEDHLKPEVKDSGKYFEEAPYDWWKKDYDEGDLPMFGSIGWMYTCFWDYLMIQYTDGTNLIDILLQEKHTAERRKSDYEQRDQFNIESSGHPMKEYPGVHATASGTSRAELIPQLMNMINAITEQGEGGSVAEMLVKRWDLSDMVALSGGSTASSIMVKKEFQPSEEALKKDYPYVDDQGNKDPKKTSGNATARIDAKAMDHFLTFKAVEKIIQTDKDYQTWDQWHAAGNKWSADMLEDENYKNNKYKDKMPTPQEVADALNYLKENDADSNYALLSQAAVGTIKGITTQLDKYWNVSDSQFPSPAMYGSGDRVSICWAVTGQVPELWMNMGVRQPSKLYHACQGMILDPASSVSGENDMPSVEIFHSCKGSNTCKTEGGCGFVQSVQGGSQCGGSSCGAPTAVKQPNETGDKATCSPSYFSAPANNKCGGLGGCAVPISASQLYPAPGSMEAMQTYAYGPSPDFQTEELCKIPWEEGDSVYDIAWEAYERAMAKKCDDVPSIEKPKPDPLRIAFPPST